MDALNQWTKTRTKLCTTCANNPNCRSATVYTQGGRSDGSGNNCKLAGVGYDNKMQVKSSNRGGTFRVIYTKNGRASYSNNFLTFQGSPPSRKQERQNCNSDPDCASGLKCRISSSGKPKRCFSDANVVKACNDETSGRSKWNGSSCVPKKNERENCGQDSDCVPGLKCVVSSSGKPKRCFSDANVVKACNDETSGRSRWNGSSCVSKKNERENCGQDSDCVPGLKCVVSSSGKPKRCFSDANVVKACNDETSGTHDWKNNQCTRKPQVSVANMYKLTDGHFSDGKKYLSYAGEVPPGSLNQWSTTNEQNCVQACANNPKCRSATVYTQGGRSDGSGNNCKLAGVGYDNKMQVKSSNRGGTFRVIYTKGGRANYSNNFPHFPRNPSHLSTRSASSASSASSTSSTSSASASSSTTSFRSNKQLHQKKQYKCEWTTL